MVDLAPEINLGERGSTSIFEGSVSAGGVTLPASSAGQIVELEIHCLKSNPSTKTLLVSFDGGTTFPLEIEQSQIWSWTFRDSLYQIKIKGTGGSVDYLVFMNRDVINE